MGIMAGIGGLVGGIGGLFGGGTKQPDAPPQFIMPNQTQAANNAFSGIQGLQPFSSGGFNILGPAQNTFSNLYNNPFASTFQGGASTAMGLGQNAALNAFNTGGNLIGTGMNTIPNMASAVFNTSFDPQSSLYARTLQQTTDAARANAAAAGLATTPYGVGLVNQATNNFNIDWQNNQLQRQALGANTAGSLFNTGAGIANLGTGIQNTAPGQFFQATGLPYSTFGQIGQDQNAAIAALLSGTSGGANLANLPIQDYLSYLQAGNQANSVANQNYGLQLQAQQQQFNEQLKLGGMLGQSLYGIGQMFPGGGFLGGSQGLFTGQNAFMPSGSFLDHGFGFG